MLELSPFYLQEGRANMAEWVRLKDPQVRTPPSLFVQAAVEHMPAPDNTYDAVRAVVAVIYVVVGGRGGYVRVCKPGKPPESAIWLRSWPACSGKAVTLTMQSYMRSCSCRLDLAAVLCPVPACQSTSHCTWLGAGRHASSFP